MADETVLQRELRRSPGAGGQAAVLARHHGTGPDAQPYGAEPIGRYRTLEKHDAPLRGA
ncbi:hypothetical protein [Kitasatospora sp. NPDC097643]|uniref:hypothetical protein n=1 Tax=Kitasatospora sp. NPDC097643 TaxID=3157230 RepID=UPI003331CA54